MRDLRPVKDGDQREEQKLDELADEDGQREWQRFHFEYTSTKLKHLDWHRGWHHREDHDDLELLPLEPIAHPLVTRPIDPLQQKQFAARAPHVVRRSEEHTSELQ